MAAAIAAAGMAVVEAEAAGAIIADDI